jgi:uncharacterized lipoprotein YddW (UPF0748 family)
LKHSIQRFARRIAITFLSAATLLITSCTQLPVGSDANQSPALHCEGAQSSQCPPASPREFRAAWIATVANIDWPSKSTLTVNEQKAEIIAIVNRAANLNLNALVLQVRPSADAIYPSTLEPWTEFLTGAQGRAPVPAYDPLSFWIEESHKRGIELHAWFNPYRARHSMAKSANTAGHIAMRQPQIVKSYGTQQWMDPGEPQSAKHTLAVILDVVRRYDIDAVHMDDYFYPYPVRSSELAIPANNGLTSSATTTPESEIDFPDDAAWLTYVRSGGKMTRADWRRNNVNQLVEQIHYAVKKEKTWVKFGISPFGIGKPDKRPTGIVGFSQYDKLYADVEHWMSKGWFDYLVPQLYWAIDPPEQAFATLLDYWHRANVRQRHIYSGLYTSRIDDTPRSWLPSELVNQIALARKRSEPAGHVHYSMIAIMQNRKGIADQLQDVYKNPALMPAAKWMTPSRTTPNISQIDIGALADNQRRELIITAKQDSATEPMRSVAVWLRYGSQWQFAVVPANESNVSLVLPLQVRTTVSNATSAGALNAVVAAGVDRYAREGVRLFQSIPSDAR